MTELHGEPRYEHQPFRHETETVASELVDPQGMTLREQRRFADTGALVLVNGEVPLSAEQLRIADRLHRLYQSLCGAIPGEYWPQALLDSAGNFKRPEFPNPPYRREYETR
jgi:hypothetical protein